MENPNTNSGTGEPGRGDGIAPRNNRKQQKTADGRNHDGRPSSPAGESKENKNGITRARLQRIAYLAAIGRSPQEIAKEVKLSLSHIYHLFSENRFIQEEIDNIQRERIARSDTVLDELVLKALQKLGEELESDDPRARSKAIDQVLKLWVSRIGPPDANRGNRLKPVAEDQETLEEIVIRNRLARGLPLDPPLPSPPSPERFNPPAPPTAPRRTTVPSTAAPQTDPNDTPDIKAFLEKIKGPDMSET